MVLVSVNLLAGVWPQTMRLRRGRGYAPTNNTRLAKITMRKSIPGFLFFYLYGLAALPTAGTPLLIFSRIQLNF